MSRYDDTTTGTSTTTTTPCDCEGCRTGDLPVNPFVALRVAYGMLLGEEDFRVLMGNGRGKQMLHSAWLHGSGVVWGYDVVNDGVWNLEIGAGLAIDGIGRELLHEASTCLDVRDLVMATTLGDDDKDCTTRTIEACLVAEFDSCLSAAVPTLADPCDGTRKHDDYSRVSERVWFSLREGHCPAPRQPYHRVRVLLGIDPVGSPDPSGREAMEARRTVAGARADRRSQELVEQFRRLAAIDSIDLGPARETGDCYPTLFPVTEEDSAVVLADVEIDVQQRDGCPEITRVRLDRAVRTALLPTATIQDLTCGLAPGLIGDEGSVDAGGPRVIGEDIVLSENGRRLVIPVTAALAASSVPRSVGITSLSATKAGGWVVEDIYDTKYHGAYDGKWPAIVVDLADRPVNDLIRVVVKGTGPRPVMGEEPAVPLAGLVGGPPGTSHDGHDAVWTFDNAVAGRADAGADSDGGDYGVADDDEETDG